MKSTFPPDIFPVRLLILVILGGLLLFTLWRALRRVGSKWTFLALLVITTPLAAQEIIWQANQAKYEAVAEKLVDRDVVVKCQRATASSLDVSGYWGFVAYDNGEGFPSTAQLKHQTCSALAKYSKNPATPSEDAAMAVHVLTHESMHLLNERDEAVAECMAMQRNVTTASLLGASPAEAEAIAKLYWESVYPRVPSAYSSAECKPGGALDEGLPTPPWG